MPTIKAAVDDDKALDFLRNNFDTNINAVGRIAAGEISQAFFFKSEDVRYILRVGKYKHLFAKDEYAFKNFNRSELPVPEVIRIDKFNDSLFYCISKKALGDTLIAFQGLLSPVLVGQVIESFHAVHKTHIEGLGFGWWNENGQGDKKSWREHILYKKDKIYSNWDRLYKSSFLERQVIEDSYKQIHKLLPLLPEERKLIHGDLGHENMLSYNDKITAVIDWGNASYGDPLYDVASLKLWYEQVPYEKLIEDYYKKKDIVFENYTERVTCYFLHLSVGALGFFAESNQKEKYDFVKEKMRVLLNNPS